ncbi:MAG: LysR family transcriptional regulator [Rhodomicrobium sp.]
MEMHQVRYFLSVARTLNFTKAADECHVAQPSLSRAIKKLEEELGGDLFRRERTLTHLTELGRLMMPVLAQCYDSALSAKALASSYKKGTALPLRLALSHTIDLGLLPLTDLVKTFPGLELIFFRGTADEVAQDLKAGSSELAVAGGFSEPWDRFDCWPLFSEGFSLVVNKLHPLAMRNIIEFKQLSGERLLPQSYSEASSQLSEILRAQGIAESTGDRIVSDHDLLSLLDGNVGIAILPDSTPISDRLSRIMVDGLALERTTYVYAVSGRERTPASSALIKLLRAWDWSRITLGLFGASTGTKCG